MNDAIGYPGVSTAEQGRSGLGLAAQRHDIEAFGLREGFSITLWHQDIQTGAGADALFLRPGLAAALKEARTRRCPLMVSRLDRLSRNVHCYRYSGDILDERNDWAGAQQAYAKAVTLAPDLPAGYFSWGAALARHGDLDEAIAKLKAANQRGMHWADPLKVWGDVLVKQGKTKEALEKYDDALKYAPNWTQLKDARGALAKQKS